MEMSWIEETNLWEFAILLSTRKILTFPHPPDCSIKEYWLWYVDECFIMNSGCGLSTIKRIFYFEYFLPFMMIVQKFDCENCYG